MDEGREMDTKMEAGRELTALVEQERNALSAAVGIALAWLAPHEVSAPMGSASIAISRAAKTLRDVTQHTQELRSVTSTLAIPADAEEQEWTDADHAELRRLVEKYGRDQIVDYMIRKTTADLREAEAYIAAIRVPLLVHLGTTDPDLVDEELQRRRSEPSHVV